MRQAQRYQQMVEHFEDVALANVGRLTHIADLCRAAGLDQRTLLRAFRAIRGTTPSHHLRAARLAQVREALLSADAREGTVTQFAMRFGFRELGRFAMDYRATFGESPSETLRRAPGTCGAPLARRPE
jgi:transcriptional regulator GlxA family with amidase domain